MSRISTSTFKMQVTHLIAVYKQAKQEAHTLNIAIRIRITVIITLMKITASTCGARRVGCFALVFLYPLQIHVKLNH